MDLLDSSLGSMVMVNYPYPTSFLTPLPAWPVTAACESAMSAMEEHEGDPKASLYAIAAAGNVYYNYEG